ncbi:MAG TPA: hypothetical protein IAC46_02925 [Candidatus Onthoplasma faecigallinarum]|nr:hypothetical protein [Candidatus Onthoplasma faecigallinarum]
MLVSILVLITLGIVIDIVYIIVDYIIHDMSMVKIVKKRINKLKYYYNEYEKEYYVYLEKYLLAEKQLKTESNEKRLETLRARNLKLLRKMRDREQKMKVLDKKNKKLQEILEEIIVYLRKSNK